MSHPARLAVFGRPIAHSRSPEIHQMFAAQFGISLTYEKMLVPEGEFKRLAEEFLVSGTGFNVTVPLKHEAFAFCQVTSDAARLARAVNTVYRKDGVICGDNTDGPGLVRDLTENLKWNLAGKRILVLGAGGAVSGVIPALIKAGPELIHIFNRTQAKAQELVARHAEPIIRAVSLTSLDAGYDVIINGTSAGLHNQSLEIPENILAGQSCCYDMVYGKAKTNFLQWCENHQASCRTADGLGMLVEQAASAFEIWFGQKPATAPVIAKLRQGL